MAVNIVELLGDIPAAQNGYLTRAQAAAVGVEDYDLHRSASKGFIHRVGHGVYRVAGAPSDRLSDLRIAWLRLRPEASPRQRVLRPDIWVSHESAASVHGFGVFLADTPTFTSSARLQPGKGVKIHRRSAGMTRHEWIARDGFAVTGVERTAADLFRSGVDGGHLGRFINDAVQAGAADAERIRVAMGVGTEDFDALIEMSAVPTGNHE